MSEGFAIGASVVGVLAGFPIGSAFAPLVNTAAGEDDISLSDAFAVARARSDWRIWQGMRDLFASERPRSAEPDSDKAKLFILVVLVVWLLYVYAIHAEIVATILAVLAAVTGVVTLVTFTVLHWRRVVDGREDAWRLVLVLMYIAAGLTSAVWLLHPPLHPVLPDFLARVDESDLSLSAAIKAVLASGEFEVPVLICQLIGAAIALGVLLSGMALCVAAVASVYVAIEVRGMLWTWLPLFWCVRWSTSTTFRWWAIPLALVALLLTGGFAIEGAAHVMDFIRTNAE